MAARCRRAGALLILDEVITGFRVGRGGMAGALGVTPDLVCYGKVIGGGFPVGAYARPRGPDGPGRAGRPRLPGRHAQREPGRHARGPRDAAKMEALRRLARARASAPARSAPTWRATSRPRRRRSTSSRHASIFWLRAARRGAGAAAWTQIPDDASRLVRAVLSRRAGPRRLPAAVGVRGLLPVAGARRPRRSPRRADALAAAARRPTGMTASLAQPPALRRRRRLAAAHGVAGRLVDGLRPGAGSAASALSAPEARARARAADVRLGGRARSSACSSPAASRSSSASGASTTRQRAVEAFFMSFTHDLKTALASLQLQAESLQRGSARGAPATRTSTGCSRTRCGCSVQLENSLYFAQPDGDLLRRAGRRRRSSSNGRRPDWPELAVQRRRRRRRCSPTRRALDERAAQPAAERGRPRRRAPT